MVAEDYLVVVYLNTTGTHKCEFQGISLSGKQINIRSANLFRIDSNNGTIVEHLDVADNFGMLQQLRVVSLNK